ncbi:MAG: hypothetical protein A2622_12115 [Bdellovibrionales bacterium RIFCSPHIGHO2_01_FULL_40_29]|nr:MAG: hypothetical protein A2622_12115 [Bdellovibrionales bacterium RIFCSPHIGHO2_01_FULL_40_29]OFZ32936.1 MAG: hypothetical protein A3D17_09420 [Bdellovibrionales bacterium RIFCSPHIGHO2_02_FULL_40_15]
MSKFSDLLSFKKHVRLYLATVVFTTGCVSSNIETQQISSSGNQDQSEIRVDKDQNSIKITSDGQSDLSKTSTKKQVRRRFQFDWPVWEARMTRGFLPRGTKRRRRPHKGIDLAAPRGTAVMSAHDGQVIYAGKGFKGYGKMVMVESPEGWATLYAHLDKIIVPEGFQIKQGEVIGALGNTGRSSGPHLHFEIRKLDGPVDPLPLLPAGEALTNEVDDGAIEE